MKSTRVVFALALVVVGSAACAGEEERPRRISETVVPAPVAAVNAAEGAIDGVGRFPGGRLLAEDIGHLGVNSEAMVDGWSHTWTAADSSRAEGAFALRFRTSAAATQYLEDYRSRVALLLPLSPESRELLDYGGVDDAFGTLATLGEQPDGSPTWTGTVLFVRGEYLFEVFCVSTDAAVAERRARELAVVQSDRVPDDPGLLRSD